MTRTRLLTLTFLIIVILSGLASRHWAEHLPGWVGAYVGDVLWAMAVYLLLRLVFPRTQPLRIAAASLAFAALIELSQLFHPAWLDDLRTNPIATLILGRGFLWSDLVCYTIGVIGAWVVDVS